MSSTYSPATTRTPNNRFHDIELIHIDSSVVVGVCKRSKERFIIRLDGEGKTRKAEHFECMFEKDYLSPGDPWFYYERMYIESTMSIHVLMSASDYMFVLPDLRLSREQIYELQQKTNKE